MYEEYCKLYSQLGSHSSTSAQEKMDIGIDSEDVDPYKMFQNHTKMRLKAVDNKEPKTEVDKYLMEVCEDPNYQKFDILKWRKTNSSRYKILSLIARDVFAIHVSTVVSESIFSTCGNIIGPYRSTLNPKTVQALICTQNWLHDQPKIELHETLDEVETIEKDKYGCLCIILTSFHLLFYY